MQTELKYFWNLAVRGSFFKRIRTLFWIRESFFREIQKSPNAKVFGQVFRVFLTREGFCP